MRRTLAFLAILVGQTLLSVLFVVPACAQQVIDRIVARVEGDIITLSEMRELGRYQNLVEGRAASDDRLLAQLIEQWIVNTEATAARYPRPIEAEVNREVARLEKQLGGPDAYRERLRDLGLSAAAVRRQVERQMYLARYLGYKFRPAVQVDSAAIEKYYREELVPSLAAKGQTASPLDTVQDQIRELLTEREISRRAAQWLDESRARLKVELNLQGRGP